MRHLSTGSSRRTSCARALGTLGVAALALAAVTTACSGSSSGAGAGHTPATIAAGAPGATDPAATASPGAGPTFGVLDTDPADPPIINPTVKSGAPLPTGWRNAPPTTLTPPAGWDPAAWLSQVHAAAPSNAVPVDNRDPSFVTTSWQWSTPAITSLTAGVIANGQNHPIKASCDAEGFDLTSTSAAAEVASTLELCARTGLSGSSAQAAQTWIGQQVGPVLSELQSAAKGRESVSAAPTFGAATYQVVGQYEYQSGYLVQVTVW
jgi:hypothetical protein